MHFCGKRAGEEHLSKRKAASEEAAKSTGL
jgi:hypothetical protein